LCHQISPWYDVLEDAAAAYQHVVDAGRLPKATRLEEAIKKRKEAKTRKEAAEIIHLLPNH